MPLRQTRIQPHFLRTAPSCLMECGGTRVLCTASVEEGVPPFLRGSGRGWLTAEYAMLPASTGSRKARDGVRRDGRGVEISRLIGRSLRQALDFSALGERTITIDCDVLEADGGTRTASITGGFVALALAVRKLMEDGKLTASPIVRQVAAVSVGVVDGEPTLDLCYAQDSHADVDMNVVMDGEGNFVEVQGTGEGGVFARQMLDRLLGMASAGISELLDKQRQALGEAASLLTRHPPRLIFATNNAHKAREMRMLLAGRYDVCSLKEIGLALDVEETGETFAENAAIKAETVCRLTGCAALADDSGLAVDALDGAPGVRSARYAGVHGDDEANLRLVLARLEDVPAPRTARFVCAIALARPGQKTLLVEGRVEGEIIRDPRGEGGFGYDPIFLHESGETLAEMPEEQKNRISHRAMAAQALLKALDAESVC